MPVLQSEQHMSELRLARPLEELLREFQEYVYRRYSPYHARNLARYVRLGLEALKNPLILRTKTWRVAKYALEALRAFDMFLRTYGLGELNVNWDILKKHLPRKSKVELDPFRFEAEKGLVEQAIEMLRRAKTQGKWRKLGKNLALAAITAFFTGLRGTEIRYMFREWPRLEKISHANVRIIHLGYDRGKKKAWITMMPEELAQILDKRLPAELGSRLDEHLRMCGVSLQFLRKAHVALLIKHLDYAEIDLLQGRLSKVIVAHYIKHIREIAERYRTAVEPYIEKLLNLLDTDT